MSVRIRCTCHFRSCDAEVVLSDNTDIHTCGTHTYTHGAREEPGFVESHVSGAQTSKIRLINIHGQMRAFTSDTPVSSCFQLLLFVLNFPALETSKTRVHLCPCPLLRLCVFLYVDTFLNSRIESGSL